VDWFVLECQLAFRSSCRTDCARRRTSHDATTALAARSSRIPFSRRRRSASSSHSRINFVIAIASPNAERCTQPAQLGDAGVERIAFAADEVSRYKRNVRLQVVSHGNSTRDFVRRHVVVPKCFPGFVYALGSAGELLAQVLLVISPCFLIPSRHNDHRLEISRARMFSPIDNPQEVLPHALTSPCCAYLIIVEPRSEFQPDLAPTFAFSCKSGGSVLA
jgi:hypothetical protein